MARYLPTLGRLIVTSNRSELFNQSVRTYTTSNQYNPVVFEEKCHLKQALFKFGRGSYVKVVSRQLSSGTSYFVREFNDGENEHAHNVLCSIPAYHATTLNSQQLSQNVSIKRAEYNNLIETKLHANVSNDELVQTFMCVSTDKDHTIENDHFSKLCYSLSDRTSTLSDDHILQLLSSLSYHDSSSSCIVALKSSLDKTCCNLIKKWDLTKVFLVADHWYTLGARSTIYFSKLLQIVGVKVNELTAPQVVQFMFYANINREFVSIKSKALLFAIRRSLRDISIEELGIITMGLFKTQYIIKDQNLNKEIIGKLLSNIEIVSNHSLGSILKFLNKSLLGNDDCQCYMLLDKLNPHLHKFNNLALLQVALFGNNLLVFHEGVIEQVGSRFGNSISELRLKDIERFTYTLMLYKYIPSNCPDILIKIIEELRKPERITEINHFPKCFVSCVNYLASMSVFPLDLISASLQPAMIQLLETNNNNMGRELSELDWSLKIEGPDFYSGYQLDPAMSRHLTKKFLGRVPNSSSLNLTHQERFLLEVRIKLSVLLGGDQFVTSTLILPHVYNADLVFCTDAEGEPTTIPTEYLNIADEKIKSPINLSQGVIWNAVVLGGRNSYLRTSTELRGNIAMKIRQLHKVGYRVSVIPYSQYSKRSVKYRLACIEKYLKETSSLNMDGKLKMALKFFHIEDKSTTEAPKVDEQEAANG